MLSPLDDYPVHQIAEPIRHVATSNRNFYHRYYFNLHGCSDELFLVMDLGQYPNLGTTDAFAVSLRNGVQRVVRASRELGNDRMDTRVGPLRMQFRDYSIQYIVREELDGTRVLEQAVKIWRFGIDRPPEPLGRPDHSFAFRAGTRMVESATLHFAKLDGSRLDVGVRPLLPMHVGVGTGYGFDADWRHGLYQGELKVQGLTYDLAKPEDRAKMSGLVDSVAAFECEGEIGYGLIEYLVLGPYARYGFKEFLDGAT